MAGQKKLGLHLSMVDGTPAERLALAREAEDLGYSSIWLSEVAGPDALVSLGVLALNTSKAELATGVVPIQIRTPGVMAMAFLTVHELSGGRAIAGLGVSSPALVERWHGAPYRKPLTAMRECVAVMRQLFTQGYAKLEGEVYRCDFRLGFRPPTKHPPKIYLAGLNAPMLRLAGEVADGVLMNYSPPEAVGAMVREIHEGARKAGRDPAEIDLGIYARMCITDEQDRAIDAFRRELATYAFVDSYNRMFTRYGFGEEFAEVRRLWKKGNRNDAPKAISEASVRKIAAFGPAWDGCDFIARLRAAGITHPVVFPIGPAATFTRDAANTMRAIAST